MDIITIKTKIENAIREIDIIRAELKPRGDVKDTASGLYDKELAKTIMGLKNGREYELEGDKIKDPPATLTEKIAKGICWEAKIKMDEAETLYKSVLVNLKAVESKLNGLQTLNKNIE